MSLPDFDKIILRAADIRGVAGTQLTESTAVLIGRAFGSVLIRKKIASVVVGGDGRLSTPVLKAGLIRGLLACGVNVIDIGCCPTPMLYFATYLNPDSAGVMVTASHNPKEYNGFKMLVGHAPLTAEEIAALGDMIAAKDFESGQGTLTSQDVLSAYVERLMRDYNPAGKPLTVVWDCCNATAGVVVPLLVKRFSGRHILINDRVDGNFPAHAPDSSKPENLAGLREAVLREKADLGIAFDGDADRLGVIDSQGDFLPIDRLLQVFAEEILKTHPQAIFIADIKSSKTFSSEIARMGGRPLVWKTGHAFIKLKMKETGALLGGEMSGHICFADKYYGYDDALYSAVRLLNIAANQTNESFLERLRQIPETFATPEIQIACPDTEKFNYINQIKEIMHKNNIPFDDTDGIKRVFPTTGWWLLRASNTSPALVGRCEADTIQELEKLKKDLFSTVKNVYPVENKG